MSEKVYVVELSKESKELVKELASDSGIFTEADIENALSSKIDSLDDLEEYFGFRSCQNTQCREFFIEGYLMEELAETYCSRECAEEIYKDLVEDDYGTDTIFLTEWYPEG